MTQCLKRFRFKAFVLDLSFELGNLSFVAKVIHSFIVRV